MRAAGSRWMRWEMGEMFGSHTRKGGGGWGGCEQGSVCDIWSGAAAQKCFEGVHTFAEALLRKCVSLSGA